uniref:Uncharacterized protein n=1 Tax=Kalanchoe fedtschenkoi TaxID=63787 RepID=A0A7N0UDJ3_KALFE
MLFNRIFFLFPLTLIFIYPIPNLSSPSQTLRPILTIAFKLPPSPFSIQASKWLPHVKRARSSFSIHPIFLFHRQFGRWVSLTAHIPTSASIVSRFFEYEESASLLPNQITTVGIQVVDRQIWHRI